MNKDRAGANSALTTAPDGAVDEFSSGPASRGFAGLTSLPNVSRSGANVTLTPLAEPRYQSENLLGRDGIGEVRLAVDQDIDRRVAVKRLRNEKNPNAVARFIGEVRTVGRLEHPNIVPIHDVGGEADGTLFFMMKYVDGETLATSIR